MDLAEKTLHGSKAYSIGPYRKPRARYIEKTIGGNKYIIKVSPKINPALKIVSAINEALSPRVWKAPRDWKGNYQFDVGFFEKALEFAGQVSSPRPYSASLGSSRYWGALSALNDVLYGRKPGPSWLDKQRIISAKEERERGITIVG